MNLTIKDVNFKFRNNEIPINIINDEVNISGQYINRLPDLIKYKN